MMVPWTTDLARKEDAQRVDSTNDDLFEWWYFDTIMDDGSTCVLNFLSKPPFNKKGGGIMPILQFNLSTPEGQCLQQTPVFGADAYSSALDRCAVTIGPNWVEQNDDGSYTLHAEADGMAANLVLRNVVPGWRTGPYLPPDEAALIALDEQVVIPAGTAEGTLTYNGKTRPVTGTCYHDHQWGNIKTPFGGGKSAITSWYWGRAQAGDHAVAFAQLYAGQAAVGALWQFARGSRMTFDTSLPSTSGTGLVMTPPPNGAPAGSVSVKWTSNLGNVSFDLSSAQQIANFSDGGYLRFVSPVTLTSSYGGENFSQSGRAIWEIMHLPT